MVGSAFHAGALYADGRDMGCDVAVARSFLQRALGLLARPPLTPRQALWITRCGSVHTVGMRYAIDVVFLSRSGQVLRVAHAVPPLRFRLCRGAAAVVELRAGAAHALGILAGQVLAVVPPDGVTRTSAASSPGGGAASAATRFIV